MYRRTMMRLTACATVALLPLGGCERMPSMPSVPTLTPYRIDIQQGNVVTQEMVDKLKPGMTPSQVRFILGTPLVVDAFHKDRWDYVYRFSKAGTLQESRRIVVVFKDDKLARIEGDVVAAQPGGVTIDKPAPPKGGAETAPAKGAETAPAKGAETAPAKGAETAPAKGAESAPAKEAESAPAKPAAAKTAPGIASQKPEANKANAGPGEAGAADAAGAAPANNEAASAKAEKPVADKPKEEKPTEERGFFGRMLDKLGF